MKNVLEEIINNCKMHSDEIALVYNKKLISYGEMYKKSVAIAQDILNRNIDNKTPIAIIMDRSEKFIISMLGVMLSGHTFIPMELPYPNDRIKRIMHIYNEIGIIYDDFLAIGDEFIFEKTIKMNYDECILINVESQVVTEIYPKEYPEICYVMFTSGTTMGPKGVKIGYDSLNNLVFNFLNGIYEYQYDIRNVGVLSSFSFDACLKQIMGALSNARTLYIAKKEDKFFSIKLQEFLFDNDIDVIDGTPSIYSIMMKKRKKYDINVKYFLIGGEIMYWEFVNDFYSYLQYQPVIFNLYGPTECCVDASYYCIKESNDKKQGYVPIGKPICNAFFNLENVHSDSNKNVGELYISGILVGNGYVGQNTESFFLNSKTGLRTYKTGDLCYIDETGDYVLIGRNDGQIKVNGNRVETFEVKESIKKIVNAKEVIIKRYKKNGNERLCAIIIEANEKIDRIELLIKLKNILPEYAMPKRIVYYDGEVPINKNGKIDVESLISQISKTI